MTERASPLTAAQGLGLDRASDRAALPQGSAKPSAQLLVSGLALSGASRQLPQRGSPWQRRKVSAQRLTAPLAAAGRKDSKPETWRTAKASHFGRGGIAQAMTERASPLTAAHRVRLDCTCDGAAYTCDRTAYTCDRANGFIFPTHDHLLPPLPAVASGLRQSPHRARGVAGHIISDAIKIRCARRLTPPGTPLRGIVISPAYNVGRCK